MSKFFVKCKLLIDGMGSQPIENGVFEVENSIITNVGVRVSEGSEVVDLSDYTVMPGLVDGHTHLSIVPSEGNQLEQMALPAGRNILRSLPTIRKQLQSGVTTMRIMGEEHYIDLDIKRGIAEGLIEGPRIIASGIGIAATNGHGVAITTSDTEYEVRKNIRSNFRKGADFVKMFITGGMSSERPSVNSCCYSRKEIAAAVEEAERMDSYVAVHAHGGPGVDICIEEGVRTIEHGALLTQNQINSMKEKNMWVVGTFSIMFHPTGIEMTDFSNPYIREKVLNNRKIIKNTFGMIFDSGLSYAIGTDSMHGLIAYEMECLTDFGASNMDAIVAATSMGAKLCGVDDKTGSITAGKYADFIAVLGNPLKDIRAMSNVKLVYKEGRKLVDER